MISRKEFEAGIDTKNASELVLNFLSKNKHKACTHVEISEEVGIAESTAWSALQPLVRRGSVCKKILLCKSYFAFTRGDKK